MSVSLPHVLVLGGASGVGKSAAAALLARRFGVGTAQIDDLFSAVVAMTEPTRYPALHSAADPPAGPEGVLAQHRAICAELAPALDAVIATHLDHGPPVVLEGDFVRPDLPVLALPNVSAVFLLESEEIQLTHNLRDREPESGEQRLRAQVSARLSGDLAREAAENGIPAVTARPWASVLDRIIDVVTR